jgi:hypothetical protein
MANLVSVGLERVLASLQDRARFAPNIPYVGNHSESNKWYCKITRLKWKLVSVHLEIVLILTQDRCTVCAECTIGSEIFWTHEMELLGDVGLVESVSVH